MKVSIGLIRDSFSSYPQDEIEFNISDQFVTITVSDNGKDRELVVDRDELSKLLSYI